MVPERVVPVMVLAAGLGSRLRPLTASLPKPLVPVGDRPAIAHVLQRLAQAGMTRVVVNVHHGARALTEFAASRGGEQTLAISAEPELLGTAGGLAHAAALLGKGDVLVWNADILAALDPVALVAAHAGQSAAAATLVVQQPLPMGQGTVGLDAAGRIVRLRGERVGPGSREIAGGEFLGVHVVGKTLRETLPERGCLVGDVYIPALRAGARLQSFAWRGSFVDIGSLRAYLDANLAWLAERDRGSWVGSGARVEGGVALVDTIVGEGATVTGRRGDCLERCVVWPGAVASAPLSDAVVVPGGIVQVAAC